MQTIKWVLIYQRIYASLSLVILSVVTVDAKDLRPNILFIVADDLGKGDIACYGNSIVHTPVIDGIAANGLCLDKYRSAAPISGPSRVAMMTGRYYERSGFRMAHIEKTSSLEEPWIARQFHDGGYATALFGKAHIGDNNFKGRGYEYWVVTSPGGWADYYDYPILKTGEKRRVSDGSVYATDFITNEVISFIDANHKEKTRRPFYAYIGYTAPHFPLQVPEEEITPYKGKNLADGTEVIYGMITRMDTNIGRIIEKLKDLEEYENTIIVFVSDNGPTFGTYQKLSQKRWNCGLAGAKEFTLEGGINVPCVVQWPKRIAASNSVCNTSMTGLDWAPTLLDAAGITPSGKPFDGVSFLASLMNKDCKTSVPIRMWSYNKAYMTDISNVAVIDGEWKLYRPQIEVLNRWDNKGRVPQVVTPTEWQLFNLSSDPGEKVNVISSEPERTTKMLECFNNWWKEVLNENREISGEDINP